MTMSKSIKDYKDAMDNIKISDSFYKRTEALLNESSEIQIEKTSAGKSRIVMHAMIGIAACFMIGAGVKTIVESRSAEGAVTEIITIETETVFEDTASPVIDSFEEDDSIFEDMPEITYTEVDKTDENENVIIEEENPPVTEVQAFDEEETLPETAVWSAVTVTETTVPKEGYPEMAEPKGVENIPPLADTATNAYSVEITPYFDIGRTQSGSSAEMSGEDCADLIASLSTVPEKFPETENEAFESVFSVQISDKTLDTTVYSIYITNSRTLVVTRHDIDDQKRISYNVSTEYFNNVILKKLFSYFGEDENFDFFIAMIS